MFLKAQSALVYAICSVVYHQTKATEFVHACVVIDFFQGTCLGAVLHILRVRPNHSVEEKATANKVVKTTAQVAIRFGMQTC